jgi:predicted transcriptional regulator
LLFLVHRPPPKNYSKNKPEVEKRPKTAFILYLMEERPKLIEANPGIHQMDVFRKIGMALQSFSRRIQNFKHHRAVDKEATVFDLAR